MKRTKRTINIDICKTRAEGISEDKYKCKSCRSINQCKSRTLRRLLSVIDDLNKNIFVKDEELFLYIDKNYTSWNHISEPDKIPIEDIDEYRLSIKNGLIEWSGAYDRTYIRKKLNLLDKRTIRSLDKLWPQFKEWSDQYLDKVHVYDTKDPEKLTWSLRMPYLIMDTYMSKTSSSAWKVFCYIARRATFDPENKNFGLCYLQYGEIERMTGVKTVSKYVRELEKLGLIRLVQIRKTDRSSKGVVTVNKFTVKWFHDFENLGINGYS
jgi:hypothetical protein